jgi:hypothetical protein
MFSNIASSDIALTPLEHILDIVSAQ